MTEDKKPDEVISTDEQEEAFFSQKPAEEDPAEVGMMDMDEELLWENQEEIIIPPIWQPIVPLLLALCSLLVLYFFIDDFRFALSTPKTVDLGSTINGCQDTFYKRVPNNRMVTVRGVVPQPNLTAKARVHFSNRYYVVVLGCDLLVSLHEKRYYALIGAKTQKPKKPGIEMRIPQHLRDRLGIQSKIIIQNRDSLSDPKFVVKGRALLASRSGSINNLHRFYAVTESMNFTPHTYIIFDGEDPTSYWWVLLVYTILSAFFLYNIWRFLKAGRNLLQKDS